MTRPWLPIPQLLKKLFVCFSAPGYRFKQVRPTIGPVLEEDLISFDWQRAQVKNIGGRWKIVIGNMWLKDFEQNENEARVALKIIQHYHLNKQGFVGRPDPSMEYYLIDDKPPTGSFPGEDAIAFDPSHMQVKQVQGRWKLVENGHWVLDFGAKEDEAMMALQIIKKYGFDHICYVGRPDPSMTYFRK
jgi:hypothetical protein